MSDTATVTHTPGPWKHNVLLVNDARGNQIAHCTRWERGAPMPEVAVANARLIAAAPELLEAAKNGLDLLLHYGTCDQVTALEAAIAKAEGNPS